MERALVRPNFQLFLSRLLYPKHDKNMDSKEPVILQILSYEGS
jgi:hypothetical protein